MQYPKMLLSLCMLASIVACSSNSAPPTLPTLGQTPAPAFEEGYHAKHIAEVEVKSMAAKVRQLLDQGLMMEVLVSSERVKKPQTATIVSGQWPQVGAVRWVQQEDGNFVYERVIEANATGFSYQIWGMTAPAGRFVDYGRASFVVVPLTENTSKLTWTYELRPKSLLVRPIIDRFVSKDFSAFMEAGVLQFAARAPFEPITGAE
jgi:hypothetical protein